MEPEFSRDVFEKKNSIIKFHEVRAGFHVGRETDMTKLRVAFRNFVNSSKKICVYLVFHVPYNVADDTNLLRKFGGNVPNSR